MPKIGFLLLLLCASYAARCQGRDTALAVHKLFAQKRGNSASLLAASADAFSCDKYIDRRPDGRPTAQEARQDVLVGLVFGIIGVFQGGRYSVENEAETIRLYRQGWGLAPDVRRKLKGKHFRVTAKDVRAMRRG